MKVLLPTITILVLLATSCATTSDSPKRFTNDVIRDPDQVDISYLTSDLDRLPVIKRGKLPSHPDSERWSRGYARAAFTIYEKGRTENIRILESSGKSFGGNTAHTIRFWRFEPALKDGAPTPCEAIYEVYFRGLHFDGTNE